MFYAATSERSVRLAVKFVGFTNDATGAPMTIFDITNSGSATAVIWGYYKLEAKQHFAFRYPTICLGHYVVLASGRSQTVMVHKPETKGSWKASFGYGRYNWQTRWAIFAAHLSARIRAGIPQRLRGVPEDSVTSDWIE